MRLRILGPDPEEATRRLIDGLEDAEFAIPGQIVADIAITDSPKNRADGSIELGLEALTIAE